MAKRKRANTNLQSTTNYNIQSTQNTKNGATRIRLKLGVNSGALKGISVPAPRVKPVKSGLNNSKCKCSDLN